MGGIDISPGITGNVMLYRSNVSKNKVNQLIKLFFIKYPLYKVPSKYLEYTLPYSFGSDSLNKANPLNSDSTNFFFYLRDEDIVLRTGLSGGQENWDQDNAILALIGIVGANKTWSYGKEMTEIDREKIRDLFEKEILSKLDLGNFTPIGQVN